MSFDPDKIFQALLDAGTDWSDKQAAADLLEETRKCVLALLVNQHEGSMAAKESLALADPAYRLHIISMVNARQAANRARVNYDARKVLAELRRTQQSTLRTEMTLR